MALTAFFPRPVRRVLAGRPYLVRCLTLGDLADLHALRVAGDPLGGLPDEADPGYADALRAAAEAIDANVATASPAHPLEPVLLLAKALDATPDGAPTLMGAAELARRLTAAEWSAVERVAYDLPPAEVARRLIDRHLGLPPLPPAVGNTWPEVLADAARRFAWASPGALASLPLATWRAIASGGQADDGGEEIPPGMGIDEYDRVYQEPRRRFWGAATEPGADGNPPAEAPPADAPPEAPPPG